MARSRRKARRSRPAARRRAVAPRGAPPRGAAPVLPMPEALYAAGPAAGLVVVPARAAIRIDGAGGPEGQAFPRAIGAIYGIAYTLKFARKAAGKDFKIGPLEGRWWAEGVKGSIGVAPRESWRWRLRMAVPDDVTEGEVAGAIRTATIKRGGKLEGSAEAARVALERIPAQAMGRVLHVGPYADEQASFEKIRAVLGASGRASGDAHLEVYLSDPRRSRPERLKTVLLLELAGPQEPTRSAPGRRRPA